MSTIAEDRPAAHFSIADETTWPVVLTAEQVSAIYQRSAGGLKKACQLGRFLPAPFQKQPYRWRRSDLLRSIDGGRGPGRPLERQR